MKSMFLNPRSATLVVAAALFSITSCKKDNSANNSVIDPDPIATVDAAQGEADASGQFEDVFNVTMGVQSNDAGEDIGLGTGANIIYKPADANGTLTFATGIGKGDGQIVITEYDLINSTVSGTFKFNLANVFNNPLGGTTLNFQQGVFYKVPIITPVVTK